MTVVSALQQLTVEGAADTQGRALTVGRVRKLAAHSADCRSVGVDFIPLVIESLGGWDDEVIATIGSIGRLLGQRLGIPPHRRRNRGGQGGPGLPTFWGVNIRIYGEKP